MYTTKKTTAGALRALHDSGESWARIATSLGFKAGKAPTLCQMSKRTPGAISEDGERDVRIALKLEKPVKLETVEVPEGCEVRVVRPQPDRVRARRFSVPADPEKAAVYVDERMTPEEVEVFIVCLERGRR